MTARSSQGLGLAFHVQAQVQRQHVLPRPVEEGHLPAAMSAGEAGGPGLFQIALHPGRGEAGGGEAVGQACAEEAGMSSRWRGGTSQRTKA